MFKCVHHSSVTVDEPGSVCICGNIENSIDEHGLYVKPMNESPDNIYVYLYKLCIK